MYYSHPIVQEQVRFLVSRRFNYEEWNLLAWERGWDPVTNFAELVEEKDQVLIADALESLIEAHSKSFFPFCSIKWKHYKKRVRVDTERRPNPHPRVNGITAIHHWTLYPDFHYLKDAIDRHLGEKLANWPEENPATENINELKFAITWVLNDGGPNWSGLKMENPKPDQSTKLSPPKRGKPKYLLPSPKYLQSYTWDLPQFDDIIRTFKAKSHTSLGDEGRPACLAYVLFSQLLNLNPSKIQNIIQNYERSTDSFKRANVIRRKRKLSSK